MKTITIHPETCNPMILIVTDNVSPTSSTGGGRLMIHTGQQQAWGKCFESRFFHLHTPIRGQRWRKTNNDIIGCLKGSWEQSASTTTVENGSVFATKSQDPNASHFVVYSCVHIQGIPGSMTVRHKPECWKASLVSSWRSLETTHTPLICPDGKISIHNKNKQWQLLRHGWIW